MNEWNGPLPRARDRVKLKTLVHKYIRWLLEETQCQQVTAEILGMHPGALSRKIDREKIAWTKYPGGFQRVNGSPPGQSGPNSPPPDDAETGTDD